MKWTTLSSIILWVIAAGIYSCIAEAGNGILKHEKYFCMWKWESDYLVSKRARKFYYFKEQVRPSEEEMIHTVIKEVNYEIGVELLDAKPLSATKLWKEKDRGKKENLRWTRFAFECSKRYRTPWLITDLRNLYKDFICFNENTNMKKKTLGTMFFYDVDLSDGISNIFNVRIFVAMNKIERKYPTYMIEEVKEEVLKHELLHSLGFGHYKYGVMTEKLSGAYAIDKNQLWSWKDFMNKHVGGVYDIHGEYIPIIY